MFTKYYYVEYNIFISISFIKGHEVTNNDWYTTDIEVRIKDTNDDSGLAGQIGTITGLSVSYSNYF